MKFGFACDGGWFDIIYNLCKDISKVVDADKELKEKFVVLQVKEKLAGLRFYVTTRTDKIVNLISEAEKKSFKTCEMCGKEGVLMITGNWYKTLCDACAEKHWGQWEVVRDCE